MMAPARRGGTLRRLAWFVAALAVACGDEAKLEAGPLDRMYLPTGLAVHDHKLLVASSNADLRYDDETGGSVIAFDPRDLDSVSVAGAVNIRSFGGDLAIAADPVACGTVVVPEAIAVVATRGSNTLNVLRISDSDSGALSCDRCGIPISASFVDPLAVAIACAGGHARAFVGYLRATSSQAWITEYDLDSGTLRNALVGVGPVRALAYDAAADRLYVVGLATGQPTPLRWVGLSDCEIGVTGAGACTVGQAAIPALPPGVELRSIALAHHPFGSAPQRAFLTGRIYDPTSAATAGGRTVDYGGLLIVVDLVDNAFGGVDVELVDSLPIGRGAQDVRVLPARAGKRDVVAALAVDEGELWIYDDDTGSLARFGRNAATGAPELGHQPYGLAVDAELVGTMARLYVGSFAESFVTPIDVPLDTPDQPVFAGGTQRKISGGTPTP
jgi:hypothetical protein